MFRPLTREEQKAAFAEKRAQFQTFQEAPPAPIFPIQPVREMKPTETEQLTTFQQRLSEYGITPEIQKAAADVKAHVEENNIKQTISTFYCQHFFTSVKASWMGLPINYKICSKCGLVK